MPIGWGALTGGVSYISYAAAFPNADFSCSDFTAAVVIGAFTRGIPTSFLWGMNGGFGSDIIDGILW